jgi:peptidoglycan hydrolase-like protein with peptidoglycan-binding domain
MRLAAAVLLCVIAAPPMAQTQKPAKSEKAAPAAPVPAAYAAMPLDERVAIQTDLIWIGAYNGTTTGDFGPRAVAAVKLFQKEKGGKETGVLSPAERTALAAAARSKQEAVGWLVMSDSATRTRLGVPLKLLSLAVAIKGGTRFRSPRDDAQLETFRIVEPGTTLATLFEQHKKEPGRRIDYNVLRPDFFVVSGLQGQKKFYVRAQAKDGEVRGFIILYDPALDRTMEPIVVAMSNAFIGFPAAIAGPPPRPKTEYSTGIAIGEGRILAHREATDGCYVITAGGAPADRLAVEKDLGLALLRVYGPPEAPAIAFATGAPASPEVTLVGIADPQMQGGGDAVSAARAKLGDGTGTATRPIEPAPAVGFSGAAALDAQGRLIGVVSLKPAVVAGPAPAGVQAVLVPGDLVERFLKDADVAPASAAPVGLDAAKGAVVRVMCARK